MTSNAVAASSMDDFVILKKFNVKVHPLKALQIIEVLWNSPIFQQIKCNTDDSFNNVTSSFGGIFRDKDYKFILCFAENTGQRSAFNVELCGAMRAIEFPHLHEWHNLWLEFDDVPAVNSINNYYLVP